MHFHVPARDTPAEGYLPQVMPVSRRARKQTKRGTRSIAATVTRVKPRRPEEKSQHLTEQLNRNLAATQEIMEGAADPEKIDLLEAERDRLEKQLAIAQQELAKERRDRARGRATIIPQAAIQEVDEEEEKDSDTMQDVPTTGPKAPGSGHAPGGGASSSTTPPPGTLLASASSSAADADPFTPIQPQTPPVVAASGPVSEGEDRRPEFTMKQTVFKYLLPVPNERSNLPSVVMRRGARKAHQKGHFNKAATLANKALELRRKELLEDCFSTSSLQNLTRADRLYLFAHTKAWASDYLGEYSEDEAVFTPPPGIGDYPSRRVRPQDQPRNTRSEVWDEVQMDKETVSPEVRARHEARAARRIRREYQLYGAVTAREQLDTSSTLAGTAGADQSLDDFSD